MSQPDNYAPQEVTGTTSTIDAVLVWTFDGIEELSISQTDGTTTATLEANDFDAFVVGQTVTVENYFGSGNTTTITVSRATKRTQEFSQTENNPLDAEALNAALDKLVRMIQDNGFKTDALADDVSGGDLSDLISKAITSDDPFVIPGKEGRQNVYLAFDDNGNLILTVPSGVTPPDGPLDPENYLTILNDIKVIADPTYTFLDADTGKFLIFTNTGAITVTTPEDLVYKWQAMIMKAATGNVMTHVIAGGATHDNPIDVSCSADYGVYSAMCWSNSGGTSARVRFVGEIDATSEGLNEELVSRTVTLNAATNELNQQIIELVGKYLHENVKIHFKADLATTTGGRALEFNGFGGPGSFVVEPLNAWIEDHTARPVQVTNTNTPLNTDYTF
jgi:hypothetical protein